MTFNKATKVIIPTLSFAVIGIYKLWSSNSWEPEILPYQISNNLPITENISELLAEPNVQPETITLTGKSEEQKRIDKEIADKAFGKIGDYSFRMFSPCGDVGTGWILDYQIPEKGKYPKVWYIATVAHALKKYRFSENPYKQELPYSVESTQKLRNQYRYRYSGYSLYDDFQGICPWVDRYGYFDMNIAQSSNGQELKAEYGGIHNGKMKEPKLFFVAMDLFDEDPTLNITKNNYKDFAVLEIEFNDEEYAKKVTNNFANTYGVNAKHPLNIFAKPLDERYTKDQINKLEESFYNLAYPWNYDVVDKYGHKTAWDEEKAEGYKLSYDHWRDYHYQGQKITNGYGDAKKTWKMNWNGKEREDIGHLHLLKINKNSRLGGGASGSLYTDKEGNVLGLHHGGEPGGIHSYAIPLRANENRSEGSIKTPKYDLILGAEKQKSSYKQQIETYGKNTWLKARNWQHKS